MQGKILIVEDDPAIRALLRAVFEGAGHEVFEVADGLAALGAAQEARPDIVLLDVGLPGLDGFGVLGRLKDDPELRDVPVIMVTAWAEPALVAKALDRGAHDYVRKPFDVKELAARVEAALQARGGEDFLARDGGSSYDPLTGLPGRRHLAEVVERQTQAARRTDRPFCLLHVMIEGLEQAGADHSPEVAADALRAAARRLRRCARVSDVITRAEGDALVIVAPGTLRETAEALADDLRAAIGSAPLDTASAALRVTAAVCVTQFQHHERPDELIARATGANHVLA